MGLLAWLRRLLVSLGVGMTSYGLMIGFMLLSVLYARELKPVIALADMAGHWIVNTIDAQVRGNHWGQVAVNHLRERVNMTHVVLSIPAIVLATFAIGIPLNWALGGTRTALQRIAMAFASIPTTVALAVALFTFNAFYPDAYAALLRFAVEVWRGSLAYLSLHGNSIPGVDALVNAARQGFSGHHYVIMALLAMISTFLVNALFTVVLGNKKR